MKLNIEDLKKTALFDVHTEFGAKMVEFAGYAMPVQYKLGIKQEHMHVRQKAGLFDVSHMGQVIITSPEDDPAIYLEKLVPSDIQTLKLGKMRYTTLLNDNGGIFDDLIITRLDDNQLFAVFNAARKQADAEHIIDNIGSDVDIKFLEEQSLLAVQGPLAADIIKDIFIGEDVEKLSYMSSKYVEYEGYDLLISRSGYTGEDGFEISVPNKVAESLAKTLLAWRGDNIDDILLPIGLGARDSLRLEAGFCLYGHDIDENTTPVEASLSWIISKNRRENTGFLGDEKILSQLKNGTNKKRVGLRPEGKAPIRKGTEIFDNKDNKIGIVTSGGFSPVLNAPIAMGYISSNFLKNNSSVIANLRGRNYSCRVVDMPFVKK